MKVQKLVCVLAILILLTMAMTGCRNKNDEATQSAESYYIINDTIGKNEAQKTKDTTEKTGKKSAEDSVNTGRKQEGGSSSEDSEDKEYELGEDELPRF